MNTARRFLQPFVSWLSTGVFVSIILLLGGGVASAAGLPKGDLEFLRTMTLDVMKASSVPPGSNGGGRHPLTNVCGFTLITPGKDTYPAFWVRDFSMAADTGFIAPADLRNHLLLICKVQNGPSDRKLANGLHLPPWAIPDHINYDGSGSFYPGGYGSGENQGDGTFGRVPPIDDHYEFVNIAYLYWKATRDVGLLESIVQGTSVFDRLENAFNSPTTDSETGLVQTTENDRAVGFGFCDAEAHTGKLLVASLFRHRTTGEMIELCRALRRKGSIEQYRTIQKKIRANLVSTFGDRENIGGWLRASTELSRQPDVWGTLYALHLGLLGHKEAALARKTIADAVRAGTITQQGAVRQVPTNMDFNSTTAWERSVSPVNTYQNGAYWHTASGWLIEQLWKEDRKLALHVFEEMIAHLRAQDFRKGQGYGAPWEDFFGANGPERRNAVYMVSVALPYSILKELK